jgi:hypothetical protein
VLAAGGMVVLFFLAGRMNAITFGMLTGGFAASSFEILLLISFQIIYGYVYFLTGVIISIFMAGLAFGAILGYKVLRGSDFRNFIFVQLCIGGYALIFPLVLTSLNSIAANSYLVHAVFSFATFAFALCIGAEFALGSRLQKGSVSTIASNLYSVDLVGSAIGALLVTAYLIPLLGITKVFHNSRSDVCERGGFHPQPEKILGHSFVSGQKRRQCCFKKIILCFLDPSWSPPYRGRKNPFLFREGLRRGIALTSVLRFKMQSYLLETGQE